MKNKSKIMFLFTLLVTSLLAISTVSAAGNSYSGFQNVSNSGLQIPDENETISQQINILEELRNDSDNETYKEYVYNEIKRLKLEQIIYNNLSDGQDFFKNPNNPFNRAFNLNNSFSHIVRDNNFNYTGSDNLRIDSSY
ncbi:hypothetical protein [Candidatus Methanosphaera massiliense]|jgi:hypothetical protein|uniref:hypothetical protein n=1 Tax=Methanosphaera TaxID=2316 RepID=UPI002380BF9A|nr:hypothetical protein [Candidatus Methanosphaera massiliense]MDD6285780.1 hypothetical protein [Methanobacteriaceae archaeon]MDE4078097.1 hypothetical protein [Candidatus Methanosphaera massiliense]